MEIQVCRCKGDPNHPNPPVVALITLITSRRRHSRQTDTDDLRSKDRAGGRGEQTGTRKRERVREGD